MGSPSLLAVDLDGTLLARTGEPHRVDVEALIAAREAGVVVTILTGRLIAGTRGAARALGLEGPIGCADGGHIVHLGRDETLLHRSIRGPAALRLQKHLQGSSASTYLFVGDAVIHDGRGDRHLEYLRGWSPKLERIESIYDHASWAEATGVTAVVSVGTEASIRQTAELVSSELNGQAQALSFQLASGHWGLIARAHGVSKGTALKFIAEHSGVAMADTVAVGDWLNDVPMFEVAGRSYAMGQAPDAVRNAVTAVLPETAAEGGGIARVVRDVFGVVAR